MKRIGFVINSRLPNLQAVLRRGMLPHYLATGWDDSASPMSLMRFRWIAEKVNNEGNFHYEIYKPWRRYDAVVLVKSMAYDCIPFAKKAQAAGTRIFFDANVDYYTPPPAEGVLPEMLPTEAQRTQALEITGLADGVLSSSRHLAEVCSRYSRSRAEWIPDNVNFSLIPAGKRAAGKKDARLLVWWSGMPQKLFEFLAIEKVLRKHAGKIHLHFVTNDTSASQSWPAETRRRFGALLHDVPHTIHTFHSVDALLKLYAEHGGIVISPRFLDMPYNLGHSEWKITLAMACGLPALCSPVPSYEDVMQRAGPGAIRICQNDEEWDAAFSALADGAWDREASGEAAVNVVKMHYSTDIVAKRHREFVSRILA